MSERTGIPLSTLAKVEHDRLTLTYDKLLQLSQRLNLRMSDLFSEADAASDAPITARRSIGRLDRRDPRQHAELRVLLHVPGTAPQAHGADRDARAGARASRSSASWSTTRARNTSTCCRARSRSTPSSTSPSCCRPASPSTSTARWATPTSRRRGTTTALLLGICSSADDDLMESLMTLHDDESPAQPKALRRLSAKR